MTRQSGKGAQNGKASVRCAIYTRKSSEEGLEQDFNSLDAQREACEAYVASQKHEGWTPLAAMYDDGGISGGTMKRPALKRLIDDIRAGTVDTVVVYKVDRLTRSLSDFAKIVDIFDRHDVSFVSVTQQFNTTTSMGRLTLNMLLSFAQFERDVTGERIRDKIAASKKKGMWMGGNVPLGYDAKDRKLVVNQAEAETVRTIFRTYLKLGSVRRLKERLDDEAIISKVRVSKSGRTWGGKPFSRGALYQLLQNRIYRGEIAHKGEAYPGQHAAIIDEDLWDSVQAILAEHRVERSSRTHADEPSLLTGLIFDAAGVPMTPSHAVKNGKRYRYYVSRTLIECTTSKSDGQRIPAASLEPLIINRIRELLNDPVALLDAVGAGAAQVSDHQMLAQAAEELGKSLAELPITELASIVKRMVSRIEVRTDSVEIDLDTNGLVTILMPDEQVATGSTEAKPIRLNIEATLRRTGVGKRMVLGNEPAAPDASLIRLVARAFAIRECLLNDPSLTLRDIAADQGVVGSYVTRLLRLAFLAPDIVTAILEGRQPAGLTATRLSRWKNLPLDWTEQRRALGFS